MQRRLATREHMLAIRCQHLLSKAPIVAGLSDRLGLLFNNGLKTISGSSVMKGFATDPNFAPYIDDIYAYLQARADGALGRGRPKRMEP
ncbi:hypothetical protein EV184_12323 [Sinorhizobium americanum]|uniref:Uncharacterized protein n=1 Tax=Sinorhizobium americanum TaxID=194963 RepID=A0A4R2B7U3_9HYPH|nr:hypothetical protein EV184_12323 [Sinorhizobium americanum]